MTDLRYPIGRFTHEGPVSGALLHQWIDAIAALPGDFRRAVEGLTDAQLDTPYRLGGWTIRQVVHHVPDSHLNAYVRWKLALTEETPTIKPYDETRWVTLGDFDAVPLDLNLRFLELLHEKWVALLRGMRKEQWSRQYLHPVNGLTRLDWNAGSYAWHGRHHLAHITTTIEREGW